VVAFDEQPGQRVGARQAARVRGQDPAPAGLHRSLIPIRGGGEPSMPQSSRAATADMGQATRALADPSRDTCTKVWNWSFMFNAPPAHCKAVPLAPLTAR
jgi:hypothetical protein